MMAFTISSISALVLPSLTAFTMSMAFTLPSWLMSYNRSPFVKLSYFFLRISLTISSTSAWSMVSSAFRLAADLQNNEE